ncbi:hypothetical protein VTK73DRAFT_7996 [Phialemonium thermophilum]|uniref:Cytochrome P450 n=1 Tax=Phialemonium thermophilum TaxID=223376 RepID=A0ABR3XQ61_9PEZI
MARYRLQRRLIGSTYSARNLSKFQNAVNAVIERAVAELKTLRGEEVDLKEWMHIITVECLGAVVLSWSPGYIKNRSDGGTSAHSYLGWRRKSIFGLFPPVVIAKILYKPLGRAFANIWGVTHKTPRQYRPFFAPVYQKSSRRISAALGSKPPRDVRADLLTDLIQLHKAKPAFTETYLRRLAVTNFGAGHETMCSALTSSIAMIGTHPGLQRSIADEARRDAHSPGICTADDGRRLPLTKASIREAQRLYPVIGMALPRVVPPSGPGLHAHGYWFPPGTTVGCNPLALHRNTAIFGADADKYRPERWLEGPEEAVRAMERYNLTWGGGSRRCPGRYLAELIVHSVVPALVREFEIEVKMPPDEDIRFYFMAMLTGVKARFVPRDIN